MSKFKVGDRVRRTRNYPGRPEYPKGYEFVVGSTTESAAYAKGTIPHEFENLELAATLSQQLTEAEAEVARIKALIEAEKRPKVGETWAADSDITAHIKHIEDGFVFYTVTGCGGYGPHPAALSVDRFTICYRRVDKTEVS